MRKVKRIKFGKSETYKGYEYQINLMIDLEETTLDYKSWFQVEVEKGSGLWAFILDKKQTVSEGKLKIFDYIDRLAKQAENVA